MATTGPFTETDMKKVAAIFLEQARAHFPSEVKFEDANASINIDPYGEEWIRIELIYLSPEPVLDGELMNTLYTRTQEPLIASGFTAPTSVRYTDMNDPTRMRYPVP